ncbi:DUF2065 domain-containing protein [Thiotrichales bacterium 19S3-7]|nr:DUF2065 domain-containing protein [Thiotrichales bacterium 19S3-7]MCF6801564.1 DUF2065 domain-containing protein [Thiotrichales bacterium 19S3-11]
MMSLKVFFIAIGIVLIIEGLYPALAPEKYQNFLKEIIKLKPQILRIIAIVMMIIGLLVVLAFIEG